MDNYVTELIDYIDTYRLLLERDLYDKSRQTDINELYSLMDKLNESYNIKSGLDSYDFQQLRKKISYIFHPDVYKVNIPQELGINLAQLNARFNGAISSILKDKKEGATFKYDYQSEKQAPVNDNGQYKYNDDWGYNSFRENTRHRRGYYDERGTYHSFEQEREKEERRAQRQQMVDNAKEAIKNAAKSAYQYSKERVGAWLFDIPTTQKDYYSIKNSLTYDVENLRYRKTLAMANSRVTEQKKNEILKRWQQEVSEQALTNRYNDEVINSFSRVDYYRRELENANRLLMSRLDMHAPEYRSLMMQWEKTAGEIFADFMNSRVELKNKQDGYAQNDGRSEKEIMKSIKKFEKELDRYPKRKEAENIALTQVTKDDEVYKRLKENYNRVQKAYNEAMKSHVILTSNKAHIMRTYIKEINKKYNSSVLGLDIRIKHFNMRDKMLDRDIEHSEQKLKVFIETYGSAFTQDRGQEREPVGHRSR